MTLGEILAETFKRQEDAAKAIEAATITTIKQKITGAIKNGETSVRIPQEAEVCSKNLDLLRNWASDNGFAFSFDPQLCTLIFRMKP